MRAIPLLSALLAPSLFAQGWVVPSSATAADANAFVYAPFTYDGFEFQQIWAGTAVAPNSANIQAISYRRDTDDNTAFGPGIALPLVDVRLGYAAVPPSAMSTSFAANRAGATTMVFSGAINLPQQPPAIVVASFNVTIPLQTPFNYTTAQGPLLCELTTPVSATQKVAYFCDAAYYGSDGVVHTMGTSGKFGTGTSAYLSYDGSSTGYPLSQCVPGGAFTIRLNSLPGAYPTAIVFGLSSVFGSGFLLPYDLTPFGAPSNTLYVSVDASTPLLTPTASGSRYQLSLPVNIPNHPNLAGRRWYNQAFTVDASANALGAVFSNGMTVTIGGNGGAPETNSVYSTNVGGGTGSLMFRNGAGGPVVEFSGTFQ